MGVFLKLQRVPQCSLVGPVLLTLYMVRFSNIIIKYCMDFHCHIDNTQLHLSIKPDDTDQTIGMLKDIKASVIL